MGDWSSRSNTDIIGDIERGIAIIMLEDGILVPPWVGYPSYLRDKCAELIDQHYSGLGVAARPIFRLD
jgi:hypothetical protein